MKDMYIYSSKFRFKSPSKFSDIMPILLAEGSKSKANKKRAKAIQAGTDEFSDDEEYEKLRKFDKEFAMIIKDWYKTPIYHILMRKMKADRAIIKYCNKTSLNRLAADLRERR